MLNCMDKVEQTFEDDKDKMVMAKLKRMTEAGEAIEDPSKVLSLGTPVRSLHGHSHIVQDVCLTYDGQYALSASWDNTLRLWNLTTGKSEKTFIGHSKDVLSVCFSPDNRLIMSAGRDRMPGLPHVRPKGCCQQQ